MIQKIYAIQDLKKGGYEKPFCAPHDVDVVRSLKTLQEGNAYRDYAEDFQLVQVGLFDQESGSIAPCQPLLVVVKMSALFGKEDKIHPLVKS